MKHAFKLVYGLGIVVVALIVATPALAVPENPPNDNQCICHHTQYNNKNQNENAKAIIICVDPNSVPFEKHMKHGDFCVSPVKAENIELCNGEIAPETCLAEPACNLESDPFNPSCCSELAGIDESECDGLADEDGCVAACFPESS